MQPIKMMTTIQTLVFESRAKIFARHKCSFAWFVSNHWGSDPPKIKTQAT